MSKQSIDAVNNFAVMQTFVNHFAHRFEKKKSFPNVEDLLAKLSTW